MEKALYDIEHDFAETRDVSAEHPEVVKELMAAYDKWWEEVRPLLVNEDAPLEGVDSFNAQYQKQKSAEGIPDWVAPEL